MSELLLAPVHSFRWPRREASIMIPLFLLVTFAGGDSIGETIDAIAVGVALAVAWTVGVMWSMRRTRFGVDGDEFVFRAPLRVRVVAEMPGEVRIVRVPRADASGRYWQVWMGDAGAVTLNEEAWNREELDRLAQTVNASSVDEPRPLSMRELGTRFPTATPWLARHMRETFAVLLLIVAMLILIAAILG